MTDEWLAGFFDGEGCISGQSSFLATKYIKKPRVQIQISITQKDRIILEQIQNIYGGVICSKESDVKCWVLKWVGKQAMTNILRILAPHCICKREQILLGLRFCETLREENLGCIPLSDSIHSERKEIFNGLRSLEIVNGNNVS